MPKSEDQRLGEHARLERDDEGVLTTGFESWSSSFPGDVWTKIPTIGSARNASVTTATATKQAEADPSLHRPTPPTS